MIWQLNRFCREAGLWVWTAVPRVQEVVPGSYRRYAILRPEKNGISHTLMDPGLLLPRSSTPRSSGVGGWLRHRPWGPRPASSPRDPG